MSLRVTTEEVTIRLTIADSLPPVVADPVQIEQVLLNLAVNGSEAMPDGGVLSIAVSDVALGESYAHRHHGVQPGHYVCPVVTDSGVGMDRATRERIFEPFFTTKTGGTRRFRFVGDRRRSATRRQQGEKCEHTGYSCSKRAE